MRASTLVALALLAAAGTAQAANLSFLNQSILLRIPKAQVSEFSAEVGRVLNETPDGQRATWSSRPAKSRQTPVSVTLAPRNTTQTGKGQTCRFLAADVEQGKARENWGFWFCKQESGAWRASAM
ncbi:hypothetical protein PIGHUM_04249 [Pigmentiphaga humi]|uniref:Surface antigen domain-containing protein n=1 Tax=Pigmentiphaga humi TaxID=2478468 RepID=A0A3P4B795_9BURK|nr:hypothetical protein [Pigmentiphaga humi]VCU72153.1 hypothetical protein PIGHUM_04249 [Pigmentiphaga humi]